MCRKFDVDPKMYRGYIINARLGERMLTMNGFWRKLSVVALALLVAGSICATDSEGQSKKPGQPSSGNSSKSDKPKFSAPQPSKPSPPPAPPKADPPKDSGKPKFSAPPNTSPPKSDDKDKEKPKFSAPPPKDPGKTPVVPPKTNDLAKPKVDPNNVSGKAQAAKEARSERKYEESLKATQAPKPKYTAPNGKEVNIKPDSRQVAAIRNQPSEILRPEVRQQHTVTHIHTYHYHHDYNWYRTQPVVYVGGGYSSAFWWMMAEWSAERRALWLYHNRHNIEHDAYMRGVQDAQVAQIVARMEAQKVVRDAGYIDPEFNRSPHLMYDDDYVEACYNPVVVHQRANHTPTDPGAALHVLAILGIIVLLGVIAFGVYYFVFQARWGR